MFQSRKPRANTLSTYEVLQREFEEIWGEFPVPSSSVSYYKAALLKNQAALCLSGGGIRSAAFALGVMEALAKKGLLTKFHYLSTVSGGGYIGGFLTRWIHETGSAEAVQEELARAATPGVAEPRPVQWLREYSNFLTPRTGLASADTWSAAVLWIRNTLINWFVFLPFFIIAVGFPSLYLAVMFAVRPAAVEILLGLSLLLVAFTAYSTCRQLPSHASRPASRMKVLGFVAAPAIAASFLLPLPLTPFLMTFGEFDAPGIFVQHLSSAFGLGPTWTAALLGGGTMAVGLVAGYLAAWAATHEEGFGRNLHVWIIGSILSGAAVGLGVLLADPRILGCYPDNDWDTALGCNWSGSIYAAVAPLWVIVSQLLLSIFYTAFRRTAPPKVTQTGLSPDVDREWLARLSAVKLRTGVVAAVFITLALVVPILVAEYWATITSQIVATIGAASGLTAVLGGKAPIGNAKNGELVTFLTSSFNRIVVTAALIALAVLTIFLSRAEITLTSAVANSDAMLWLAPRHSPTAFLIGHLIVIGIAWGVLAYTSRAINVNRFSLNAVYRNRLGRAFLGAVRERDADPFTNFDTADNVRMGDIVSENIAIVPGGPRRVLYPVVNLALNLVGGSRLAWQERKAHSFIVSPLASGSPALVPRDAQGQDIEKIGAKMREDEIGDAAGAYVATSEYAGRERDARLPGEGITLATAMAISGAAASPNMGYNSSPATAFLMTLFNVRLGAWLPNPGYAHLTEEMKRSAPREALMPFLRELSGQTTDRAPDVYLSDGGHFENLGIYEMIRRRCRYIVVSDAGCDPDAKFEDLGNAIRKVMADLDGVAITFRELKLKSRKEQSDPPVTYAYGEIDYGKDEDGNLQLGHLLYVKPSYFSSKPPSFANELSVDIRAYANLNETFPHESTGDQWFSESQFESYRRLGETLVYEIGRPDAYRKSGLEGFFKDVRAATRPADSAGRALDQGAHEADAEAVEAAARD